MAWQNIAIFLLPIQLYYNMSICVEGFDLLACMCGITQSLMENGNLFIQADSTLRPYWWPQCILSRKFSHEMLITVVH